MPAASAELLGTDLTTTISGQHYDCVMGGTPLEWIFPELDPEVKTVPYTAIVRGKTVDAEYMLTDKGRLSSDGYGEERQVSLEEDASLNVTRADGRAMTCKAR